MATNSSNKNNGSPYDLGKIGKSHSHEIGWGRVHTKESGGYDLSKRDPYSTRVKANPDKKV